MSSTNTYMVVIISVLDPHPFRSIALGLPGPGQVWFHEFDPDTDPRSKQLAKIMENSPKKSTEITQNCNFQKMYYNFVFLHPFFCIFSIIGRPDFESDPNPFQNETDPKHCCL